jgi:hypothetical protein
VAFAPDVKIALVKVLDSAVPASALVATFRPTGPAFLMPSAFAMVIGPRRQCQRQRGASHDQ